MCLHVFNMEAYIVYHYSSHLHPKKQICTHEFLDPDNDPGPRKFEMFSQREMNSKIKLEEAALVDYKRTSTKMWMGLKFGGLVECCEKGAVRILFFSSIFSIFPNLINSSYLVIPIF